MRGVSAGLIAALLFFGLSIPPGAPEAGQGCCSLEKACCCSAMKECGMCSPEREAGSEPGHGPVFREVPCSGPVERAGSPSAGPKFILPPLDVFLPSREVSYSALTIPLKPASASLLPDVPPPRFLL